MAYNIRSYNIDVATVYYFVADNSDESPNEVIDMRVRDATPRIIIIHWLLAQNYSKS